jgi:hypothetical protein
MIRRQDGAALRVSKKRVFSVKRHSCESPHRSYLNVLEPGYAFEKSLT